MKKIAIIGAGLSGLTLAHYLKSHCDTTVFEKSRGVSGRMSTRYTGAYEFDHGAQYFTAKSDAFKDFLKPFINDGVIQKWDAKMVTIENGVVTPSEKKRDLYVGAPRMNALCKRLAKDRHIHLDTRIDIIKRSDDFWALTDHLGKKHDGFHAVISSAPAPQTADIISDYIKMPPVTMTGCVTTMIGLKDKAEGMDWDFAKVKSSPIGTIAYNAAKPGRTNAPALVIQSTNDWAEAHIDDDRAAQESTLLAALRDIIPIPEIDYITTHLWRYAATSAPLGHDFIWHDDIHLGACGDWCVAGKIEGAFDSALTLSKKLIADF